MSTTDRHFCLPAFERLFIIADIDIGTFLFLLPPVVERFTDEFRVLQFPTPIAVYTCAPSFFVFHEEHAPAIHSREAIEFSRLSRPVSPLIYRPTPRQRH